MTSLIETHRPLEKATALKHDEGVKPFLKWAGGKRQRVKKIKEYIPARFNLYFEPFVGGGAVLFNLQPAIGLINDINEELINCYKVIKENPEQLINRAKQHPNTKRHFYKLRSLDRKPDF